jgi:molybdenum cofactor cytidylyltransferase
MCPKYNPQMVAVIILAAGRSTRMGRSKPLLPHGHASGLTFVAHLIDVSRAAGLVRIIVVGRPEDEALDAEVSGRGARFVENPAAESGQLSSLQAGLSALQGDPDLEAVMVMPVDVPLVSAAVVKRLLEAAGASSALILRAAHAGRHGHPVIFRRSVFDELHAADPALGAKAVVRADPTRVEDVDVQDPGVALDVDTPEDYLRAFGRRP